jgi:Carboxyl transferase domain
MLPQQLLSRSCPSWLRPSSSAASRVLGHRRALALRFQSTTLHEDPSLRKVAFRERWHDETQKALLGGGQARIDKQHAKGSLTARERIELLFDEGTFHELDQLKSHRCVDFGMNAPGKQFPGDGIVTG